MEPLRVACPADDEAQPLAWGLDLPPWDRSFSLERNADPLQAAARLATGELDAAVLPAHLAAAQADRLELIPGLAVASRGASGCGLLLHRVPLQQLRSAIDLAPGHAAGALCAVLFAAGGSPMEVRALAPGAAPPEEAEALVGPPSASMDAAGKVGRDGHGPGDAHGGAPESGSAAADGTPGPSPAARGGEWGRLDLGRAWSELTGLPFVWWVWVARPGVLRPEIYRRLHTARSRGRQDYSRAAGAIADGTLRFRLGNAELEGLRRFWAEGHERRVFPSPAQPRLYSPRPDLT